MVYFYNMRHINALACLPYAPHPAILARAGMREATAKGYKTSPQVQKTAASVIFGTMPTDTKTLTEYKQELKA